MFLIKKYDSTQVDFDSEEILGSIGIDRENLSVILSEMCSEGYLEAKVNVRCPYCDADYGRFNGVDEISEKSVDCFNCQENFSFADRENWRVVYNVEELPEKEEIESRIKKYVDECYSLSEKEIQEEFEELKGLEPTKRGRLFDYFMGLLFLQVEGIDVRVQEPTAEGEVDVHLSLYEADNDLRDIIGTHSMVENKWQQESVNMHEISKFGKKLRQIPQECYVGYFVAMNGFADKAQRDLDKTDSPTIISWQKEDLEEFIYGEGLEKKLRDDIMRK